MFVNTGMSIAVCVSMTSKCVGCVCSLSRADIGSFDMSSSRKKRCDSCVSSESIAVCVCVS